MNSNKTVIPGMVKSITKRLQKVSKMKLSIEDTVATYVVLKQIDDLLDTLSIRDTSRRK